MVAIGDMAPEVEGTTSAGEPFKLSSFRGKKNVVLFFYPGDFTPVCTKEACGFRDIHSELVTKDTEVIGISKDSNESHQKFAKHYDLGYPLLSDPDHAIAKRYGATNFLTSLLGRASRTTYLIDKEGKIAAIMKGELSASTHLDGVKNALGRMG